jgi:hypothetical protein
MGPGPKQIGWLVNESECICTDCLDGRLQSPPVTIEAALYDEDGSFAHRVCDDCNDIFDEDVEVCGDEDCCCQEPNHIIDEAKELLDNLDIDDTEKAHHILVDGENASDL